MYSAIFAIVGVATLLLSWVAARGNDGRRFANPLALFLAVYGLVYFVAPAVLLASGRFRHAAGYSAASVGDAFLYLLLFCVCVGLGYFGAGGSVAFARFTTRPMSTWK